MQADYEYAFVLSIDFGTTYSGASPKQGGAVYPKVPTVLLYKHGTKEMIAWGYEALVISRKPNNNDHLVKRFKLLLDPNENEVNALPNGLTVLNVLTDYLRIFYKYVEINIKTTIGITFNADEFMFCLTVPAMWNDQAKATMREAALQAGIIKTTDPPSRLVLTSEPEAAAMYCKNLWKQFKFTHGKRFMICDAGGGTVDLIVFEVYEESNVKTLREVTKGSGRCCGSTFLDVNMLALIKKRFGVYAKKNNAIIKNMLNSFIDSNKAGFERDDDEYIDVIAGLDFGDQDGKLFGVEEGKFKITKSELCNEIFDPVIEQSKYLYSHIKTTFEGQVKNIAMPPRGEMAVTRGAVIFGLQPRTITHRIVRRTYGLMASMAFDFNLDSEDKKIHTVEKGPQCIHRFSVFAKRGDLVAINQCISKQFTITYPHDTETDLYAYNEENLVPRYIDHPDIKKVGIFPIKMPKIEKAENGEDIDLLIKMYFGLTEIHIEATINDMVFKFRPKMEEHEPQKSVYLYTGGFESTKPNLRINNDNAYCDSNITIQGSINRDTNGSIRPKKYFTLKKFTKIFSKKND
ncbi:hypothetical protein PHYBLDRAFT_143569 [Phycomyces blakesleeanus NRRL 1555(-)]|uniref:Uncharacterized protein n=1 Tax=Phycomyces blakesleeanus (strain ATCC 8743b / DSM 1359 / FGSC 10004 / NBRC 33097 / NRRL 1555) TaxID=763407 RepID=A0A167N8C7_PHYB8|nr:hypothetical protein PHYBLDRAFT_143569 [Phycomyces blakesleeanus NRRL 1555(-)]OAD75314.1 hypothetical protein PHYBLDRAFT_143569 [Phycomyces blakesleeanus NRRL 1555(-)]|eukprot:XP_018293354.1 hypothetical protein PHYBLDRAFT_143569 [Phycomyces blakesleeanus NRRL 1555(-)]